MDMTLAAIVSFLVTFAAVPIHIRLFGKWGIVGEDRHKADRPKVPEMGGITIFLGMMASYVILAIRGEAAWVLNAIASITVVFAIGLLDDRLALRQRTKLLLLSLSAVPLFFVTGSAIDLTVFRIESALPFAIVAVVGMAASSNLTNILEGFNGESVGLGVIATGFLIIDARVLGSDALVWILTPVFASLVAFLLFNKYPAKIFPGDTGTLLIGGAIGVAVIIGGHVIIGIVVLIPQIIEFFLKSRIRFSGVRHGPTRIDGNGILSPPPYLSVANYLTTRFRLKEYVLVIIIWSIGALFGFFSLIISYFIIL